MRSSPQIASIYQPIADVPFGAQLGFKLPSPVSLPFDYIMVTDSVSAIPKYDFTLERKILAESEERAKAEKLQAQTTAAAHNRMSLTFAHGSTPPLPATTMTAAAGPSSHYGAASAVAVGPSLSANHHASSPSQAATPPSTHYPSPVVQPATSAQSSQPIHSAYQSPNPPPPQQPQPQPHQQYHQYQPPYQAGHPYSGPSTTHGPPPPPVPANQSIYMTSKPGFSTSSSATAAAYPPSSYPGTASHTFTPPPVSTAASPPALPTKPASMSGYYNHHQQPQPGHTISPERPVLSGRPPIPGSAGPSHPVPPPVPPRNPHQHLTPPTHQSHSQSPHRPTTQQTSYASPPPPVPPKTFELSDYDYIQSAHVNTLLPPPRPSTQSPNSSSSGPYPGAYSPPAGNPSGGVYPPPGSSSGYPAAGGYGYPSYGAGSSVGVAGLANSSSVYPPTSGPYTNSSMPDPSSYASHHQHRPTSMYHEEDDPNTVEQVRDLMAMGFSRNQAVHALEAFDYDLTKATNYLLDQS
ncbi:hypothetical protein IWQ60_012251 [Tieghemiomyces parasiticus]|uniref:UBA domain-containing protein n=1 Tax=Tieghemiomyces parasiticus TaxID=78921 RepID=A0A9W7ZH63_9FUNG|nr:hypothetical protein IWQ60_012251 [Tieghemiomyces parasiticus]